jgi:hypothetical protein
MEYVYADVQKQRVSDNNALFKPAVVIAADTVVEVDNLTLEKPSNEEDSARMIRMLSGYLQLLKYDYSIVYAYTYVYMYVRLYACMYVCIHICMHKNCGSYQLTSTKCK